METETGNVDPESGGSKGGVYRCRRCEKLTPVESDSCVYCGAEPVTRREMRGVILGYPVAVIVTGYLILFTASLLLPEQLAYVGGAGVVAGLSVVWGFPVVLYWLERKEYVSAIEETATSDTDVLSKSPEEEVEWFDATTVFGSGLVVFGVVVGALLEGARGGYTALSVFAGLAGVTAMARGIQGLYEYREYHGYEEIAREKVGEVVDRLEQEGERVTSKITDVFNSMSTAVSELREKGLDAFEETREEWETKGRPSPRSRRERWRERLLDTERYLDFADSVGLRLDRLGDRLGSLSLSRHGAVLGILVSVLFSSLGYLLLPRLDQALSVTFVTWFVFTPSVYYDSKNSVESTDWDPWWWAYAVGWLIPYLTVPSAIVYLVRRRIKTEG